MNSLWVSLSTYGGVTTREALDVFWAAGIRHVELAIGVKPSSDTVDVLRHYQQQGMQYRAHHALVWQEHRSFNLAESFDSSYFERLADWLAAMEITAYSVHAGSVSASDQGLDTSDRFLHNLEQLGELCRDRAIRLGVETMYPSPSDQAHHYWLQNTAQIEQLLQVMPEIELVVDLAHLNLWHPCSTPAKLHLFRLARDPVLEIHISDNDGERDTHTTITEKTWWVPHMASCPLDVPIVLESRMNRHSADQVRQQVQRVQAILDRRTGDE